MGTARYESKLWGGGLEDGEVMASSGIIDYEGRLSSMLVTHGDVSFELIFAAAQIYMRTGGEDTGWLA